MKNVAANGEGLEFGYVIDIKPVRAYISLIHRVAHM